MTPTQHKILTDVCAYYPKSRDLSVIAQDCHVVCSNAAQFIAAVRWLTWKKYISVSDNRATITQAGREALQ